MVDRMIRAAKLDPALYEEVEADTGATGQAMTVVVVSSVASGIGTFGSFGIAGVMVGVPAALIGWFVWALLTWFIGTRFLASPETEADLGQLLRTIGFSSSPGVLRALGVVPGVGPWITLAAGFWMLAAMVVAVRQALDYRGTGRAIVVCAIGWVIQVVVVMIPLALLLGRTEA